MASVRPGMEGSHQIKLPEGNYGVPDVMLHGFGWARIEGLPKDCLWPVEVKEKVGRRWRVYVSSDDECYGNPQKEEIGRYSGMFLKRFGICRRNSLQNYASRRNDLSDLDESVADDLTVVEQQLLKSQELMTVRGKGGRPVPIIIPPEAVSPLSYIASSHVREAAGVPPGNNYLFPNSVDRYVRVYQTLRSFCNKLQLKAPGRITSVALRKYTATLSQMMNLDKYQMDWVCKHLGHTKSVHREAYRQMSGLVERVYIAKLMLVQDNNLSGKYKGADLHKIDVKDLVFPQDADTEVEDVAVEGDVAVEESLNDEMFQNAQKGNSAVHPLEYTEKHWHENKMAMDYSMLRNMQGLHAPLKLQMEHNIVGKIKRLPGLPSSNLLEDSLTGRDELLEFEDIFNYGDERDPLRMPHLQIEKDLKLL